MSARCALRGCLGGVRLQSSFSSIRSPQTIRTASLYKASSIQWAAKQTILSPSKSLFKPRFIHTSATLRLAKQEPSKNAQSSNEQPPLPLSSKVTSAFQPEKLSEDILTIPNVLTILRLASTPVLGYLILIDEMPYALGLLALSGFTDVLDGWLARRFKSATVFGSIADPAADKALMTVMVGALAWRGMIPIPLVLLIVGRDVALVISAFLIRYRSLPEPKSFARYWDPRLPSAKVEPTQVSKYNTFLQIILVAGCTLIASFNENWRQWWNQKQGLWQDGNEEEQAASIIVVSEDKDWGDMAKKAWHGFMIFVSVTTIWSGSSYLFGSGGVRYLSQKVKSTGNKVLSKSK